MDYWCGMENTYCPGVNGASNPLIDAFGECVIDSRYMRLPDPLRPDLPNIGRGWQLCHARALTFCRVLRRECSGAAEQWHMYCDSADFGD